MLLCCWSCTYGYEPIRISQFAPSKPLSNLLFFRTTSKTASVPFPSLAFMFFSHEGHIVRVADFCNWIYNGDGPTFSDRSSCNSFFNLLFSSLKLSQHFFRNSQSTSVCFNLVLQNEFLFICYIITNKKKVLHKISFMRQLPCSSVLKPNFHLSGLQIQLLSKYLFLGLHVFVPIFIIQFLERINQNKW